MTIVYRSTKGSALTFLEMDENIRDLRLDTTLDRVLENGNTTTKNITIGSITSTGTINATTIQQGGISLASTLSSNFASPPALGNIVPNTVTGTTITGTTVADTKGEIRLVPFNTQATSYTLLVTDHGKIISTSSGVTIPASVFSVGQNISIYNSSTSSSITITQGPSVTMYQIGTTNTGNRTLANQGIATVFCVATNTFVITGGGVS